MSYGWWFLVIFLTSLMVMFAAAILTSRPGPSLDRLADPAPLPGELPTAGYFDLPGTLARFTLYEDEMQQFAGASQTGQPFSLADDTGPLLFLSEKAAANAALEREIEQRCAEAEAKIPPRWR